MNRSARVALAGLAATVGLAGGVGVGATLGSGGGAAVTVPSAPPSVVDTGFCQDMIVHHEQAVFMARLVRDRTEDPRIAALAAGIEADQLLDIGALRGYLELWEAPILPTGPPMTWMAADHHDGEGESGVMPGMATTTELNALRRTTSDDMSRTFLKLMLRHHKSGLGMLTDAGTRAAVPAIRNLADRIAYHQREETRTIVTLARAVGPDRSRFRRP